MSDPRADRLTGNQCHCRDCDEYFTTVRNFDRHLRGSGRPECLDPASVGLVQDDHGYWQQPGTDMAFFSAVKREDATELDMPGMVTP